MQTIDIKKIGITRLKTDIIVNAANSGLREGGGVCGAIFKAAGSKRLQAACNQIGGCETGGAVITPGFDLCKYIVHAVGPVWRGDTHHEPNQLYDCYQATLFLLTRGQSIIDGYMKRTHIIDIPPMGDVVPICVMILS